MTTEIHLHRKNDGPYISEIAGPYAWGVIHHAAESFPCPPCAEEGASLMRFAHDLVNTKLDKPLFSPKDAKRWIPVVHQIEDKVMMGARVDVPALEREIAEMLAETPMSQTRRASEIKARVEALEDELKQNRAARLVKYVKRSGQYKGEIVDFTPRQFREITGHDPAPSIIGKNGKVVWDLALDVIASEVGYDSDDDLKTAIERAVKTRQEIDSLKRVLREERRKPKERACTRPEAGTLECLAWNEECKSKTMICGEKELIAVRAPVSWSVHELEGGAAPSEDNLVGDTRKAGDATRLMKDLAKESYGASPKPVCSTSQLEKLKKCEEGVKARGSDVNPFAVCSESIGCKRG